MQCLTVDLAEIRVIEKISDQWMPDVFHMDTDLMCASGL